MKVFCNPFLLTGENKRRIINSKGVKLMGKIFNTGNLSKRDILERRYNSGVTSLLLVVGLTLVNVILLVANSDTYFLFSALLPYFLADYGMFYCGMYVPEYYADVPDMEFADTSLLVITLSIAAVILLAYLLCWIFARKKKVGWLIFALTFFALDTAFMLFMYGINIDMLLDILLHAWVIISLASAVNAYYKLQKLPPEPEMINGENAQAAEMNTVAGNADFSVQRMADAEVKARILLKTEKLGYRIEYRRVKRTNELVVNGRVYDEYEALFEAPHTLTALVDGHKIEVQYDMLSRIYIIFDGEQIAKKLRII